MRSDNLRLACVQPPQLPFPCDHLDFVPFQECHFEKYLSTTFLRRFCLRGVPDSYKNLQTLALDDREVGRGNSRQLAETFLPRDSLKSEWWNGRTFADPSPSLVIIITTAVPFITITVTSIIIIIRVLSMVEGNSLCCF